MLKFKMEDKMALLPIYLHFVKKYFLQTMIYKNIENHLESS